MLQQKRACRPEIPILESVSTPGIDEFEHGGSPERHHIASIVNGRRRAWTRCRQLPASSLRRRQPGSCCCRQRK